MDDKKMSRADQYWRRVTQASVLKELADLEREAANAPEPEYSPKFMAAMDGIVKSLNEAPKAAAPAAVPAKAPRTAKLPKRTVLLVAVISVLICALAITAGAMKGNFSELFPNQTDQYTDMTFPQKHEKPKGWEYIYVATELPEGYLQVDYNINDYSATLIYGDTNKPDSSIITLKNYRSPPDMFSFDTEKAEKSTVTIQDLSGICYKNNSSYHLVWNNGMYYFVLSGNIEKEELINIANGLQKEF